jgi:excisionase family DNA binding protein
MKKAAPVEYVSVGEAGQMLGIHERSVWSLLKDADDPIPTFKVGRRTLISKAELREWMERRRQVLTPSKVSRIVDGVLKDLGL